MIKGIILALLACFIWGLIFVVPLFMEGYNTIEIALGRYVFYGITSLFILFKDRLNGSFRYPASVWKNAFYFSLIFAVGYYPCVILALRCCAPPICALILGISPVVIALYGNWKRKECDYKNLILPCLLIFVGLIVINIPRISAAQTLVGYGLGVIYSLVALMVWSWFAVNIANYLKNNPQVSGNHWSTLIGVTTLCWVSLSVFITALFFYDQIDSGKYTLVNNNLTNFIMGSAVLGCLCSWVGGALWNKASVILPISFAGQLMIFETIFGLIFLYTLEQQWPSSLEIAGVILFLSAIAYTIRQLSQKSPQSA